MSKIYCISGLGADHSVFQKISISGFELIPVNWLPYKSDDTVSSYAQKLSDYITGFNPIILGLSFGGMLAVEIAQRRADVTVIIISSAKTWLELSLPGGLLLRLLANSRIIPARLFSFPNRIIINLLGGKTDEEKALLTAVIRNSDGKFVEWALRAIANWENDRIPPNVFHIHGTADKVIPPKNVNADIWVAEGTHIMIFSQAVIVNKLVSDYLVEKNKFS